MGVVSIENVDNWRWFLCHLKKMLEETRDLVFISDRHQGLVLGIREVFPNAFHSFCYLHMEQNLLSAVKSKNTNVSIVELFKLCSRASNLNEFEAAHSKFLDVGGTAAFNFLKDKPFDKWTDLFFKGKRYGEYSSNVAESFNSWIIEERALPITSCLDGIRIKIMEQMAKRREECHLWTTILCPSMEHRLKGLIDEGFGWVVYKSSEFIFEVKSPSSHHVDLQNRSCTCNQWKVTGFPCAHAIKCITRSKLRVYDFVEHYFTVDAYRSSYANPVNPIPNYDKPIVDPCNEDFIKPPKDKRGAGRPSTKRKGGFAFFQNKQNQCGVCKQYGHNKRNCQASKN